MVGEHVSCYNPKYPKSCPSCDCSIEDVSHMLCCPKQESLRKKLVNNVKVFMEKNPTDPFVKILLIRVIQ